MPRTGRYQKWGVCPGSGGPGLEERRLYETRHTFATLMLDGGELPDWVQKMMGHETLQMIHDRYYSYIKNYQREDRKAFMENVYNASSAQGWDEINERIDRMDCPYY